MKKVSLATIMVSLMVVTVFHAGISAETISIQKDTTEKDETKGTFTLEVSVCDIAFVPQAPCGMWLVKVILNSEDWTIYKVKRTNINGNCYFYNLPEDKKYNIDAYEKGYEIIRIDWLLGGRYVKITMSYKETSRNVYNLPFLDNFPLLKQILQHDFRI